ncbi:MAG: hypothetical protein PHR83_15805 [Paludibacter sp.]|nr:hypothetical protein [Paludibacter sp.]
MKTNIAVLHLKSKDPQKVYNLGGRVYTSILAAKSTFPTPDPTMEDFGSEVTKLDTNIKAKDGSKLKNQAIVDQTEVVYGMLKSLIIYVNKIANGDMAIILLSGFDCNNDPVEHGIPGKALIKRIEDGSVACSAKIFLDALPDADRYKVEISTTSDDPESWKTVIDFGGLNRLEIRDLTAGQKIYIRVSGGNTHGWGVPSEPMVFIPR